MPILLPLASSWDSAILLPRCFDTKVNKNKAVLTFAIFFATGHPDRSSASARIWAQFSQFSHLSESAAHVKA